MTQKILIGIGILVCLTAVGFSFKGQQIDWFWGKTPYIAVLLVLIAFGSAKIWYRIEQKKQERKMQDILEAMGKKPSGSDLTKLLTEREKAVLDKILEGKSNKQIANELYVELSTVKTHINNIYKSLKVESRRHLIELLENQSNKTGGEKTHP